MSRRPFAPKRSALLQPKRPGFLRASVCALVVAVCLAPTASVADVLSQYTFGTTPPSILTPTTQAPNVTASNITGGAGVTLDLNSNQAPIPASSPWLRIVPLAGASSGAQAVTNNAYFQFSLTANAGFALNMTSLVFDIMRGGAGTRGYEVRTSIDNYAATVQTGLANTQRPTFESITVPLSGASYQGLSTITFRVYSYANGTGSVEYDNVTTNGTAVLLAFSGGYVWTGATNANWDTATANWSGAGAVYADGNQVMFDDIGSIKNVVVSPASRAPSGLFLENSVAPYTFSGAALNVAAGLSKAGTSDATFNNTVTANSVSVSAGALILGTTGSLTTGSTNIGAGATFQVEPGASFASTGGVQVNGNLTLKNGAQSLSALNGISGAVTTLTDTTLTVTGTSTYAGTITGNGSLVKSGTGVLILNGNGSTFTGGSVASAGTLQLDAVSAGGLGEVVVNAGANLNLGASVANAITLAGGTIGASASGVSAPASVTVTAPSTVKTFNAASGAGSNDIIITGQLLGSGDINLLSINGNAPDNQAFRLRGPSSDYSGTITVNPSAKLELQTGAAFGSPMGNGSIVMVGGTPTGTAAAGTYSLINLRNNSGGDTTLGNNMRISGTGAAFVNLVGGAPGGSTTNMGNLQIGDNQTVAAVSTAAAHTLGYSSVTLTGGTATFTPQIPGNTNFIAVNNIRLGAISETTAGSGIRMNGAATLTLTGVNTYTGPTSLLSGTTVLAAGATLGSTSGITVAAGATFNAQPAGTFVLLAPQSLAVNGTMTGDVVVAGTLRGSGTLNGQVSAVAGGIVAPGNSAGILTTKNLALEAASILQIELAKATAGSPPVAGLDYDRLVVSDATGGLSPTVSLAGDLSLSIGSGIQFGDVFTLIDNQGADPILGAFNGLAQGQLFTSGGQQFQISYGDDSSTPGFELTGGNDVSLLAVPEPGSALLLLGGAALCAAARRRRSQTSEE